MTYDELKAWANESKENADFVRRRIERVAEVCPSLRRPTPERRMVPAILPLVMVMAMATETPAYHCCRGDCRTNFAGLIVTCRCCCLMCASARAQDGGV